MTEAKTYLFFYILNCSFLLYSLFNSFLCCRRKSLQHPKLSHSSLLGRFLFLRGGFTLRGRSRFLGRCFSRCRTTAISTWGIATNNAHHLQLLRHQNRLRCCIFHHRCVLLIEYLRHVGHTSSPRQFSPLFNSFFHLSIPKFEFQGIRKGQTEK